MEGGKTFLTNPKGLTPAEISEAVGKAVLSLVVSNANESVTLKFNANGAVSFSGKVAGGTKTVSLSGSALSPNDLARMSQLVSADVELIEVAAPVGAQGFYRAVVREK